MRKSRFVKFEKDAEIVGNQFQTAHKITTEKKDRVSRMAVRTLYQLYGTLDSILILLSFHACHGTLTVSVHDGVVSIKGVLTVHTQNEFNAVSKLVDELMFTAGCLAHQFEAGAVTASFSIAQTLEYHS